MKAADIIVVGAGPIGLALSLLLARRNYHVYVYEQSVSPPTRSMAIGITPPTLDVFHSLGLDAECIARGVAIRRAFVYERSRYIGALSFGEVSDPYPFILSLPQYETVRILESLALTIPNLRIFRGICVKGVEPIRSGVAVYGHWADGKSITRSEARLVVLCVGANGRLATELGFQKRRHYYRPGFLMGDFEDRTGLGADAYLFFGPERPVESFPLPNGRRRWIVRSDWDGRRDLPDSLPSAVQRLAGIALDPADQRDESWFRPSYGISPVFGRGRVAVCGDAAHVMSPIGGQGMNVGFADAADLAATIDAILARGANADRAWAHHCARRLYAFRIAARRAAFGMQIGVARGMIASRTREYTLKLLLSRRSIREVLARWFMMRSPPLLGSRYLAHSEPWEGVRVSADAVGGP